MVGEFADRVQVLCLTHGGSVISWGRSPSHNATVGGVVYSLHLAFLAADIEFMTEGRADDAQDQATRLGLHWKRNGRRTLHVQAMAALK